MVRQTLVALVLLGCAAPALRAAPPTAAAEADRFFEAKVRPLLAENCFGCHDDKKQKGGLRLDSRDAMLKGGKGGPALVPGDPAASRLVRAVSYDDADLQMPPDDPLPPAAVDVLKAWVKGGAHWPAAGGAVGPIKSKKRTITDADRAFWSFQPVADPPVPAADAPGIRGAIDRFVLDKLRREGLDPAPEADKPTLIRRATFDLHGLPPTPAEVDAFGKDDSPGAWERLIDRLLASPRYGERWGRHWLDLVRYAESDGHRQDAYRPTAWPYRDYVVRSFNDDKPYDRFVREQLAGDEIDPENPNVLVATGFLRHGMYEYNQRDVRTHWRSILDEATDVTADVFLGLSMGCARCHDHKFDPILQADYYSLQAFLAPMLPRNDLPLATAEQKATHAAAQAAWEAKTAAIRAEMDRIEAPQRDKLANGAIAKFPPDIQAMIASPASKRTPLEHQFAELAYRQVSYEFERSAGKIDDKAQRDRWTELMRQLGEFDAIRPKPLPVALAVTDAGPAAPETTIPGDAQKRTFGPAYPTVLANQPLAFPPIKPTATSTGRRTALATWLTQPTHPLTARVMANRLWQYHFGRGLVTTSSDYGTLGDRPSHPELLDHLAKRFVEGGWSVKAMHRLIMTSATYRQSSVRPSPELAKLKDPENRWLWKHPARRLDAEQIRDAMLAASGELSPQAAGPSVDATAPSRSIFTKVVRNARDPVLDAFDWPDAFGSVPTRNSTTTATQSLLLINGQWPLQRAERFAERLHGMKLADDPATVDAAYQLAYGRRPNPDERAAAVAFLKRPPPKPSERLATTETPAPPVAGKPILQAMPHRGSQAVRVRNARLSDLLRVADNPSLPAGGDFTVEAFVLLESLYPDASVRVIAAQWDGSQSSPGWSLGVTSEKSKYQPRNLILQLSDGKRYEVIPSDFRIELHKTYYLAVSVKIADTSEAGITFHLKDMSDNDAPLRSVRVAHSITGGYDSKAAVVVGGRDGNAAHGWDGLIDEVRIAKAALAGNELLYNDAKASNIAAHWTFEDAPGVFADSATSKNTLNPPPAAADLPSNAGTPAPRAPAPLVDLCHALFNSNEFLYVN